VGNTAEEMPSSLFCTLLSKLGAGLAEAAEAQPGLLSSCQPRAPLSSGKHPCNAPQIKSCAISSTKCHSSLWLSTPFQTHT